VFSEKVEWRNAAGASREASRSVRYSHPAQGKDGNFRRQAWRRTSRLQAALQFSKIGPSSRESAPWRSAFARQGVSDKRLRQLEGEVRSTRIQTLCASEGRMSWALQVDAIGGAGQCDVGRAELMRRWVRGREPASLCTSAARDANRMVAPGLQIAGQQVLLTKLNGVDGRRVPLGDLLEQALAVGAESSPGTVRICDVAQQADVRELVRRMKASSNARWARQYKGSEKTIGDGKSRPSHHHKGNRTRIPAECPHPRHSITNGPGCRLWRRDPSWTVSHQRRVEATAAWLGMAPPCTRAP